jgi:hypothetical protein
VIYYGGTTENRIAGATVRLSTGQSTTADSSGNYAFTLAPGDYTVTASASGYNSASLSRSVTAGATSWGSIELARVSLTISHPGTVTVGDSVAFSGKAQGLSRVEVKVDGWVITPEAGVGVVNGSYAFQYTFNSSGTNRKVEAQGYDPKGQVLITISATITVNPSPPGTLRGVIYHGGNTENRIAGATVRLNNGQSVSTDSNGNYAFTLAPGDYTVTASASGYLSASLSRTVVASATVWGSINLDK